MNPDTPINGEMPGHVLEKFFDAMDAAYVAYMARAGHPVADEHTESSCEFGDGFYAGMKWARENPPA